MIDTPAKAQNQGGKAQQSVDSAAGPVAAEIYVQPEVIAPADSSSAESAQIEKQIAPELPLGETELTTAQDDLPETMEKKLNWIQQAAALATGHAEGRFVQSVNSSKGIYSDRSYTVYESSLELSGAEGSSSFALRWRGRYAPAEDLSASIPTNFMEEAWYRWGNPDGPYQLTLGRHYIDDAAGELVDGFSIDKQADNGFAYGGFFGFRPDPYEFSFRADAFAAGLYSAWTDSSTGRSYSRQALVVNTFQQSFDRAYLSWDAGKTVTDTVSLRQYMVIDFRPDDGGLNLTNYSLGLNWQPLRDLWINWRGETYRNIFYDVGSENIPTDTSATYSSYLSLRYVFSRQLISNTSLRYSRRNQDKSLSWTLGLALPDLLRSGATLSLSYSATDYYNAYYDSYSASATRSFGDRLSMNMGLKYWRNFTEQLSGSSNSTYAAVSGGATYLLNEQVNFSAYYEFQRARFQNGSTLGLGFDRTGDPTSTPDRADGHNFSLFLEYRF